MSLENGGRKMIYKRTEYFRHTFSKSLDAKFRIMMTDGTGKESGLGDCSLIDLSPGGLNFFRNLIFRFNVTLCNCLEFTLYQVRN